MAIKQIKIDQTTYDISDINVKQVAQTASGSYPILLKNTANATGETAQANFNSNVYVNPATGTIGATKMQIGASPVLQYNSTAGCVELIFN